jgi:hypothetical protein
MSQCGVPSKIMVDNLKSAVLQRLAGAAPLFNPRYLDLPVTTALRSRQGLSRLAAPSRPPEGLGLDWPEHGGMLERIGAGGRRILRWGTGSWCVALC